MPLTLTNVCFEGKNGHDAGVTPFPLMTQTDYRDLRAVVSVGPKPAMLRDEDLGLETQDNKGSHRHEG